MLCLHSSLVVVVVVSLASDDVAKFEVRGTLVLKAGREPSVSLSQNQLSEEDRTKLKVNKKDQRD